MHSVAVLWPWNCCPDVTFPRSVTKAGWISRLRHERISVHSFQTLADVCMVSHLCCARGNSIRSDRCMDALIIPGLWTTVHFSLYQFSESLKMVHLKIPKGNNNWVLCSNVTALNTKSLRFTTEATWVASSCFCKPEHGIFFPGAKDHPNTGSPSKHFGLEKHSISVCHN